MSRVLIACILRSDDEALTLTRDELEAAKGYHLIVTDLTEEGAVVLTARPK